MTPCSGVLSPGERVNVQIKFSPTEGVRRLIDWVLRSARLQSYMESNGFLLVTNSRNVSKNKAKYDDFFVSLKLAYSRQLVVHVADSKQQVSLTAHGQGEAPQLEFCPSVVELGPCLPASTEVEAEVTVRNPCSFPIEFYSLELDTQYLEEEKVAHPKNANTHWLK